MFQVIEKNNKKLRGTSTLLGTRRLNFDRARSFWQAQRGAWLAIDFEAWDRDHSVLLEFGYSSVQWRDGQKIEDKGHLIVKEHGKYFNTYVPNFREVRGSGGSRRRTSPSLIQVNPDSITTLGRAWRFRGQSSKKGSTTS